MISLQIRSAVRRQDGGRKPVGSEWGASNPSGRRLEGVRARSTGEPVLCACGAADG